MWRRLGQIRVPGLIRLLVLFAILTVPILAGRIVQHLKGEPPGVAGATRPDSPKRF
ncbi:MAG: hypothetical protein JNL04_21225 [Rhodospirillaceae bacterium]|nr:hypothetical protein [Rhodospirillaceae bacterium]